MRIAQTCPDIEVPAAAGDGPWEDAMRGPVAVRAVAALVLAGLLAACGATRGDDSRDLKMLIPNSPGGGYDLTGRAAVRVMEDLDVTGGTFDVTNVIGAGGSVAMTDLMNRDGAGDVMMTVGLGVVGSLYSFANGNRLQDATPLAQLIEEYEGVLVPAGSRFTTIGQLADAWRADPRSVVVGGGSSPGGPDHLFPMQLADALDIDARDVRYITYDGGGPLTTALLGGKVQVGFSGLGEFEGQIASGDLRVLAVSGDKRLDVKAVRDTPTLTESGIDLVFVNWRGVLAPPGISAERRAQLIRFLTKMHDSAEWQKALKANGWIDAFRTGAAFDRFLETQDRRVASTLDDLGLI
jgi:putative tricarboxylic transport membrane protein